MVYDWGANNIESECYRLYVEERRPLDEVMQHMKNVHNFSPSKRAYQTQFKRWEFPSKQNPAHKNAPLVERIRQLWEINTTQKEMLRILLAEGFDIKERELMRVRAKNRWLLRVPNGTKNTSTTSQNINALHSMDDLNMILDGHNGEDNGMQELERAIFADAEGSLPDLHKSDMNTAELSPGTPPQVQQKRQLRLEKLQAESEERWAAKKRRRRTRGWAGLPADPPGPPRFPSETTIDESKAFLHMDNDLYRQMRDQFQRICEEAGFIKKTVAGPEKWQAAKDRLIAENPHLNLEFYGPLNATPFDSKTLALDVVCTDVTKRMRTLERRMTIAEAKNTLGINPEESRQIRNEFYDILKADNFTSKLEAGTEHWDALKGQWISGSPILQRILPSADQAPDALQTERIKAIEVLCRDVMKRLRDDQARKDPSRKKQINIGPGPGPAPPRIATNTTMDNTYAPTASMMSMDPSSKDHHLMHGDLQIDPSLLAAAADPTMAALDQLQRYAAEGQNYDHASPYSPTESHPQQAEPAFFRLSPESAVQSLPKVWLSTLVTCSLAELRQCASGQHDHAMVQRIEGVMVDLPTNTEAVYAIERDDELMAYLAFIDGGKPTFNVYLQPFA